MIEEGFQDLENTDKNSSKKQNTYPHIAPDMEEWPINKLHKNRKELIKELDEFTTQRLLKMYGDKIDDVIAKTIYLERIRIKEEPWKVDPPQDGQFWGKIKSKLIKHSLDKEKEDAKTSNEAILRKIVNRYSEEIVATFKPKTFAFARKFLTFFFNRLLNTAAGRNFGRLWGTKYLVYERLRAEGEIEKIRALSKVGTVVVVPTHFSNLDSILIGYVMDQICGLPFSSFGAGLNLYNTGYTAYFMNRLGAYRVDRRKKNPIYLETLKGMSNLSIQHGTNTLFFPGGTRSRSGHLESKLKMGLLGTAVEAQRAGFEKGEDKKVFIVPLILGYDVTLEAKFLMEQHLKKTGKEFYLTSSKDNFYSFRSLMKFGWKVFSETSDISLSFGKPMDVLGNFVNSEGKSYDRFGKQLEVKEYFMSDGNITKNLQREKQYTTILADRIVERFYKDNIALASHLVAFSAFNILRNYHPQLDLFGLLRLPEDEFYFPEKLMLSVLEDLQKALKKMKDKGQIKLHKDIEKSSEELLKAGLSNLGVYHAEKPLILNKKGLLISEDFNTLYYYHNRMDNYGLEKKIDWNTKDAGEGVLEL